MSKLQNENLNTTRERYIFQKTSADTKGKYLEMVVSYSPHSAQPPYHYHPYQEEHFEVLSGRFHTKIDGVKQTYETGEEFNIPKNTPHWMHNISDDEGSLLWQIRPAMKSQEFFETMWGLESDGKTNSNSTLSLFQLAVILREYSDEFRLTSPPYWIQRILFGLLSPMGKLLGDRVRYPQYSTDV